MCWDIGVLLKATTQTQQPKTSLEHTPKNPPFLNSSYIFGKDTWGENKRGDVPAKKIAPNVGMPWGFPDVEI